MSIGKFLYLKNFPISYLFFFCRETTKVLDKVQLLKLRSSLTISKSINRTSSFSWVPISQQHLVFFRGLLFDFFLSSVRFLCNEGKLQYRKQCVKLTKNLTDFWFPAKYIFSFIIQFSQIRLHQKKCQS